MSTDIYPDMSQNGMNRRAATEVAHRIADEPDGDWAWMYNLIKAALDQAVEASLSREKVLREALVAIQVWDIATLQMQAMSETDKADMEPQGDYEHDARYAYPLQAKAIRTIARAALASTETEK